MAELGLVVHRFLFVDGVGGCFWVALTVGFWLCIVCGRPSFCLCRAWFFCSGACSGVLRVSGVLRGAPGLRGAPVFKGAPGCKQQIRSSLHLLFHAGCLSDHAFLIFRSFQVTRRHARFHLG